MAPAFFYHKEEGDHSSKTLIGPLQNILPTLCTVLSGIISIILGHWTGISEYLEQFIAGQDTILHEDQHDRLLFDDDNFTRSRQYFWVIASIGEFVSIIDETMVHYGTVLEGLFPDHGDTEKYEQLFREHDMLVKKLVSIKERFEKQRDRATALRDGVSPKTRHRSFHR